MVFWPFFGDLTLLGLGFVDILADFFFVGGISRQSVCSDVSFFLL
jgi:hypothetical protein